MATDSISVSALAAALAAAQVHMKAAELRDDPHEARAQLDIIEACQKIISRTPANTREEQAIHRRLASDWVEDLLDRLQTRGVLADPDIAQRAEDLQKVCERLLEHEPAGTARDLAVTEAA